MMNRMKGVMEKNSGEWAGTAERERQWKPRTEDREAKHQNGHERGTYALITLSVECGFTDPTNSLVSIVKCHKNTILSAVNV